MTSTPTHTVICPHEQPAIAPPRTGPGFWVDQELKRQTLEQVISQVRRIALEEIAKNGSWNTASIDAKLGAHRARVTNKETRIAGGMLLEYRPGNVDPGHAATLRAVIEAAFGPAASDVLIYVQIKENR